MGPASPTRTAAGATRPTGWAIIRRCRSTRSAPSSPTGGPPPELLTGHLLVATPRLADPNFARRVVLVLDHGDPRRPRRGPRPPGRGGGGGALCPVARAGHRPGRAVHRGTGGPQRPRSGWSGCAPGHEAERGIAVRPEGWRLLVDGDRPVGPSTWPPTRARPATPSSAPGCSPAMPAGTRASSRRRSTRARGTSSRPRPPTPSPPIPRGCGGGSCAARGARWPCLGLPRGPGHELSRHRAPTRTATIRAWITARPAGGAAVRRRPTSRRWPPCWSGPSPTTRWPTSSSPGTGDAGTACIPSSLPSSGTSTCPTGRCTPPSDGWRRRVGPARRRPQRAPGAGRTAPGRTLPGQHPHPPGAPPALRGGRPPPQGAALVPGHPGDGAELDRGRVSARP